MVTALAHRNPQPLGVSRAQRCFSRAETSMLRAPQYGISLCPRPVFPGGSGSEGPDLDMRLGQDLCAGEGGALSLLPWSLSQGSWDASVQSFVH